MTPAIPVSFTCCPAGSRTTPLPRLLGLPGEIRYGKTTTRVSFYKLTTRVSTGETGATTERWSDSFGTTQDRGGPSHRQQGRGDRRADARGGPVLLSDTGTRSEDRAHHELGWGCVRLHAKPRVAWSTDRAADRPDATHQPPAHAAASG